MRETCEINRNNKEHSYAYSELLHGVEIISEFVVLHDVFPNGGGVSPCDKVFHITGDQIGRICDQGGSHPNVTLLNELNGSFKSLHHSTPHHDHRKTTPTKRNRTYFLDVAQAGLIGYESH